MTTPQILDQNGSTMHKGNKIVQDFHVHFNCDVLRANAHRQDSPYIESETMTVDSTKWKIRAYPNGVDKSGDFLKFVYIWEKDLDTEADVKLDVLTKNSDTHTLVNEHISAIQNVTNGDIEWTAFSKVQMINGSSDFIINGQYQLILRVELLNTTSNHPMTPLVDLCKIVSERLFHKATSDVDIVVECTRIPAHKLILSLASPVFTAMFEIQMQESVSNEIVISDFSEDVVRAMLRCIYDWSCIESEVDKYPEQLLCIANKYELTAIESAASDHVITSITDDSAVDIFLIAHKFDWLRIKKAAMDYITVNAGTNPDSLRTLGYDLMFELLAYMANNKRV